MCCSSRIHKDLKSDALLRIAQEPHNVVTFESKEKLDIILNSINPSRVTFINEYLFLYKQIHSTRIINAHYLFINEIQWLCTK